MNVHQSDQWGPEEWADYIRDAQGTAVDAIIEGGLRMKEATLSYKASPESWGNIKWDAWLKRYLHLTRSAASHRITLSENLCSSTTQVRQRLPADWHSLYLLANFRVAHPDAFEAAVAEGRINPGMRQQDAKAVCALTTRAEREQEAAKAETAIIESGPGWNLEECDYRDWDVEPASVDLVLTDPPYADTHLNEYIDLPHHADQWLKPGGWLGVMVGQRHLPKMLAALADGPLDYAWTFALSWSASRAGGIQFLKIQNVWKPLILLRKGTSKLNEWTADHISFDWQQNDGDLHKWQQDVSPFQKLIRVMTTPDSLIADPFLGSGTTGIAAMMTGRRFIGCDTDAKAVATAVDRLRKTEAELVDETRAKVVRLGAERA